MKIGVMGAMPEEVSRLRTSLLSSRRETHGMREYAVGTLRGREVVLVFSRWGKVAAASTATTLIERFGVDVLLFTGVAGALDPALAVGDIVVARELVQHDMDASALAGIAPFEIPLLGRSSFPVRGDLVQKAQTAARQYLALDLPSDIAPETLRTFGISTPAVVSGLVASGDQFIASAHVGDALRRKLPGVLCVEMEGAAVAQVAHEHGIPFAVIRTISDRADHGAPVDFPRFLDGVATHFTCGVTARLLDLL